MKPVTMFILKSCPHCKNALSWMEELKKENSEYKEVEITIVDEEIQPDFARQHNYKYYYVPTYFVDGTKVHEGVPTKDIVQDVFETSLKD
ncbi:MAG: glutaredoxin [Gracilibacter sp. BRH_c7a]|nr:MAG: glutaredoxin [Gracilibacter sp. BRH_c7a]